MRSGACLNRHQVLLYTERLRYKGQNSGIGGYVPTPFGTLISLLAAGPIRLVKLTPSTRSPSLQPTSDVPYMTRIDHGVVSITHISSQ